MFSMLKYESSHYNQTMKAPKHIEKSTIFVLSKSSYIPVFILYIGVYLKILLLLINIFVLHSGIFHYTRELP